MCPLTTGQTPSSAQPGHIADAVWKSLVPFARETGLVNIGGYGEPLSNPKCFEYLQELDREGVHIALTTNGTMVTRRFAEQLKTLRHLDVVNVSIDSPDPDIYRRIRGGSVEKALEGVGNLAAVLAPSQVHVSSVMMRSNIDSLLAFPAVLASLNVRTYVLQGLIDYTTGLDAEELRFRNGLPGYVDKLRSAAAGAGVDIIFELPDRVAAELHDPGDPAAAIATHLAAPPPADAGAKQCFAPWDTPVIDKDGRVFPCCYALTRASAVLGNLTESSPQEIWLGERYRQFRRDIVDPRTTPDVCRTCTVVPTGPHVLGLYAAKIRDGQSALRDPQRMRLVVQNIGTVAWTGDDRIHIGKADPRDGASAFYHPSWIGTNRICARVEAAVPPGGTATFAFQIAPSPTPLFETFQLVVEGKAWLPDTRFRIQPGRAGSKPRSLVRRVWEAVSRPQHGHPAD
jgi:radical SAM protein with 4Fe4S-binding SPASM domain